MLYKNNGGKKWWVCFRDPLRPGKLIRKSTGTENLRDARSIEQAVHLGIKRQLDEQQVKGILDAVFGCGREVVGLPLASLWELYEKYITRRDRTPGAQLIRQRRKNLDDFIEWMRTEYPKAEYTVEEVTFDCAMAYADHLKKNSKLKDKSRKEYIGNLSSIWKAAGAFHKMVNPWKDVRPVVRDGVRHGSFTREQEAAVLKAARESAVPHWYEACVIARWTGLRKHDIALLEWKSVNFSRRTVRTTPIKTQGYGIEVEIPMSSQLHAVLKELYRSDHKYVLPEFAAAYPGDPNDCAFSSILKAAGVTDKTITFHSWRHTFRTRLAEAGVSDELAKRLGGWTNDSTVQRYDHADKTEEIRRAIESTSASPSSLAALP